MNQSAVVVGLGRFVLSSQLASAGDHTIGSAFENGTVRLRTLGHLREVLGQGKKGKAFLGVLLAIRRKCRALS
ncbi:MAG: hypothetical protein R6U98_26255 [Pirellulaceae bacterium]